MRITSYEVWETETEGGWNWWTPNRRLPESFIGFILQNPQLELLWPLRTVSFTAPLLQHLDLPLSCKAEFSVATKACCGIWKSVKHTAHAWWNSSNLLWQCYITIVQSCFPYNWKNICTEKNGVKILMLFELGFSDVKQSVITNCYMGIDCIKIYVCVWTAKMND